MNTIERVSAILSQVSGVSVEKIKPDTELSSIGLDSLDSSEFFMEIEEEFEILVEASWDQCKTVQDVVNVIQERI